MELTKPLDTIVAIYNIKLPFDVLNIITRYAVPIMNCCKCEKVLLKDCSRTRNLGWNVSNDNNIECLECAPPLVSNTYSENI
jgi:hypothetical protein